MEMINRIIGIFIQPRKVFESFPESPRLVDWLIPLLLLFVIGGISSKLTAPLVMDYRYEAIANNPDIPDDKKEEILEKFDTEESGAGMLLTMAIVGGTIWYLIQSGILFGLGSLVLGGAMNFISIWTLVLYVNLIGILEFLVKIPIILSTGNLKVEMGLSLLLPDSMAGTMLHNLLFQFDIFSIWRVVLIGLGMSILFQLDRRKTYLVLFGAWGVAALVSAVLLARSGISVMGM